MQPLIVCLDHIKCWMSNNFLQLNNDKTEVILFGPSKTRNSVAGNLANLTPYILSLMLLSAEDHLQTYIFLFFSRSGNIHSCFYHIMPGLT